MPTIVGILTFMSRINFVLSSVEHRRSFRTSGLPGFQEDICMVNVLTFRTLVACQKKPRQTEQIQIRLILKKQSLIRTFPVCYSEKSILNSCLISHWNGKLFFFLQTSFGFYSFFSAKWFTYISLASFLWDKCKQRRPRSDATKMRRLIRVSTVC